MSIKHGGCVLVVAMLTVACVKEPVQFTPIVMKPTEKEISGWISVRGEWTLFPSPKFDEYNPYSVSEQARCVSVVNGTGKPRAEFGHLKGKHVSIAGAYVRYDDLSDGTSYADRLLSKKYFKDQVVENSCLRDFVFVAYSISPR